VPELFRDVTSVVCVMLPRRRRQSCITRSLVELDGVKVLLICMRRGARWTEHGTSARKRWVRRRAGRSASKYLKSVRRIYFDSLARVNGPTVTLGNEVLVDAVHDC